MKNKFIGDAPKTRVGCLLARIVADAEKAGEDTDDVAVENGGGLVKADAANRAGGIAANAGQGENMIEVLRKLPAVLQDDLFSGALQVADTGVVAETFPEFVEP